MNKTIQQPSKSQIMLDIIEGSVSYIIDQKTFAMNVTHIGTHNVNRYNDTEVIEIESLSANNDIGNIHIVSKHMLSALLKNKRVSCKVKYKNEYNRLVSKVILKFW